MKTAINLAGFVMNRRWIETFDLVDVVTVVTIAVIVFAVLIWWNVL